MDEFRKIIQSILIQIASFHVLFFQRNKKTDTHNDSGHYISDINIHHRMEEVCSVLHRFDLI